jgi:tetratricopeptide (TPR) repeat protein
MAKGDFRSRRPFLRFVKQNLDQQGNSLGPASAYPRSGLIIMEEKGYDICTGLGRDSLNALAVFLAHELVHCYEKHDWEEHFGFEFAGQKMTTNIKDNQIEDETQADYLGGFLAYQAGFKTFGVMSQFLEKVYAAYDLKDENLKNYPTLKERKGIADTSEIKLNALIELFEMGNFLVAIEQYDDALEYYDKVVENFQSRELYNNIGVVATLTAMSKFPVSELKYGFPVELDVRSRMNSGTRGQTDKEYREEKLLEAIEYFTKARTLDFFYPTAYLNEGCARALLGLSQKEYRDIEWEDAESLAQRATRLAGEQRATSSTLPDALVLRGILAALKSESAAAESFFDQALQADANHLFAKMNKAVLKGEKSDFKSNLETAFVDSDEIIGNVAFREIELGKSHLKAALVLENNRKIRLAARNYPGSLVLANVSSKGVGSQATTANTTFQITAPDFGGTSFKGVTIGDDVSSVLAKYGAPAAVLSLGEGTFLRYLLKDGRGLIFQTGAHQKVTRWCIYKREGK